MNLLTNQILDIFIADRIEVSTILFFCMIAGLIIAAIFMGIQEKKINTLKRKKDRLELEAELKNKQDKAPGVV